MQDKTRHFKKIKITLMRSRKFAALGGIMMMGKTTLSDTVPTAATDGGTSGTTQSSSFSSTTSA